MTNTEARERELTDAEIDEIGVAAGLMQRGMNPATVWAQDLTAAEMRKGIRAILSAHAAQAPQLALTDADILKLWYSMPCPIDQDDEIVTFARALLAAPAASEQCKSCGGNNADVPCAYPGEHERQPHCLRSHASAQQDEREAGSTKERRDWEDGDGRWEVGFRNIVTMLGGARESFEIKEVIEAVRVMTGEPAQGPTPAWWKAAHAGAQADSDDNVFDWLETEISAVDCVYRGSPTYDHDAYWLREKALKLVAEARSIFAQQVKAGGEGGANG